MIKGEDTYIAAKVPRIRDCEVAFGYSFEKMILYAWSLGIGSTWIGGTFNRELFEKAADTGEGEYMMITSPLGYPSKTQSDVDLKLRQSVRGDERLSSNNLFFSKMTSQVLVMIMMSFLKRFDGHLQLLTDNHGAL